MVAVEIVGLEEERDPAAGGLADRGLLAVPVRLGDDQAAPPPSGATTTQRLPAPRSTSSISAKPRQSQKKAMPSS